MMQRNKNNTKKTGATTAGSSAKNVHVLQGKPLV